MSKFRYLLGVCLARGELSTQVELLESQAIGNQHYLPPPVTSEVKPPNDGHFPPHPVFVK